MDGRIRYGLFVVLLGVGGGCMAAPREVVVVRPPRPEAEVKRDGPRTLAYWVAVKQALNTKRTFRPPELPSLEEMLDWSIKQIKGITAEIEELSVVDVDQDVLDFTARLVEQLRQLTEGMKEIHWYHAFGWPRPARVRDVDDYFGALSKEMGELRGTLAQRYKLDFPSLELPPGP